MQKSLTKVIATKLHGETNKKLSNDDLKEIII